MKYQILSLWALILLSQNLMGCATLDSSALEHQIRTSDSRILTESQAAEIVGQVLKDQNALYEDPAQQARITSMLSRLSKAAGSGVPFTARLYQDSEPNAFSIGGKRLFISSTMLKMFPSDDDLLAGVLGHEMAHDIAGHHVRQQTEAYWRGLATNLATNLGKNHASVVNPLAKSVSALLGLKFSRGDEKEADILGTYYAMRAGYQPEGLTRFFETTNNNMNSNKWVSFISTHPYHPSRVATIQLVIRVLRKEITLDQASQIDSQTARVLRSLQRVESVKTPS